MSAAPAPSGLVNNSTSDTPSQNMHINVHDARLRKMKKSVTTSASIHQDTIPSGYRSAMVTLTYSPDQKWTARHITRFIKLARQFLQRRKVVFRYVWVCELTRAGVPHYPLCSGYLAGFGFPSLTRLAGGPMAVLGLSLPAVRSAISLNTLPRAPTARSCPRAHACTVSVP